MIPGEHPLPGLRLGSYEVVRLLGVGGMASVYEAHHALLGKRVAIKVLHEHLARNTVAAARFMREARVASAVRHPHVVNVFEIGLHAGTPFLVMELLEGQDLARLLFARRRLSASDAVDILLPAASAVAAAHAAGVIHRDLKPTNVFLASDERTGVLVKVVDFGVSKQIAEEGERGLTETETLLGTLEYMAPEQVRCAKNANERSDQYSLAVILYECVTGRRPFGGQGRYELSHAIVTAPFATPQSLGIELDPRLESAVLRAMNRDAAQRFPSVEAMARALLPYTSETLRAWWRDEFDARASTVAGCAASESPNDARPAEKEGEHPVASSAAPTLREPTGHNRGSRNRRRRLAGPASLTAIAVVLFWAATELRPRASARQKGEDGVHPVVSVVSASATSEVDPRPGQETQVNLAWVEPSADTSNATTAPSRTASHLTHRHDAPQLAPPTTPVLSSPSASPVVPAAAQVVRSPATPASVERGYNGAPIVE